MRWMKKDKNVESGEVEEACGIAALFSGKSDILVFEICLKCTVITG